MSKSDFLYKAAYSTQSPEEQLTSLAEEYFRIVVVKHKMDKLFDLGSSITTECTRVLNRSMNEYGYYIKKVVIRDIEPEASGKNSTPSCSSS
jgi:regulator of protease activity HflC (stomatin/prohibitin superfamily)